MKRTQTENASLYCIVTTVPEQNPNPREPDYDGGQEGESGV